MAAKTAANSAREDSGGSADAFFPDHTLFSDDAVLGTSTDFILYGIIGIILFVTNSKELYASQWA